METRDMNPETFADILDNLTLRVLGYKEDAETWVALALEMDIRGYGATFEEAFEELKELVDMQISFALYKNMPELIFRSADKEWFERWDQLGNDLVEALRSSIKRTSAPEGGDIKRQPLGAGSGQLKYRARSYSPPAQAITSFSEFSCA